MILLSENKYHRIRIEFQSKRVLKDMFAQYVPDCRRTIKLIRGVCSCLWERIDLAFDSDANRTASSGYSNCLRNAWHETHKPSASSLRCNNRF